MNTLTCTHNRDSVKMWEDINYEECLTCFPPEWKWSVAPRKSIILDRKKRFNASRWFIIQVYKEKKDDELVMEWEAAYEVFRRNLKIPHVF